MAEKNHPVDPFFTDFGKILARQYAYSSGHAQRGNRRGELVGFGRYLRAMRLNRKLSIADLANRSGLPEAAIYTMEAGMGMPDDISQAVIANLAKALAVPPDRFTLLLGPYQPVENVRPRPSAQTRSSPWLIDYRKLLLAVCSLLVILNAGTAWRYASKLTGELAWGSRVDVFMPLSSLIETGAVMQNLPRLDDAQLATLYSLELLASIGLIIAPWIVGARSKSPSYLKGTPRMSRLKLISIPVAAITNLVLAIVLILPSTIYWSAPAQAANASMVTNDAFYRVDPIFIELLADNNRGSLLGPAISPTIRSGAITRQYFVGGVLVFDPYADPARTFSLVPVAAEAGISEPPVSRPGIPDKIAYANGHIIYPDFVALVDGFGGLYWTGKPLSEVRYNLAARRYEQYFENVGFYRSEDSGETGLLAYGAWRCQQFCSTNGVNSLNAIDPNLYLLFQPELIPGQNQENPVEIKGSSLRSNPERIRVTDADGNITWYLYNDMGYFQIKIFIEKEKFESFLMMVIVQLVTLIIICCVLIWKALKPSIRRNKP